MQARRPTHQETIRVHTLLTQLVPHITPLQLGSEVKCHVELNLMSTGEDQLPKNHSHQQLQQQPLFQEQKEPECSVEAFSAQQHLDHQLPIADEDNEAWKTLVVACNKCHLPRLKASVLQCDPTLHCIRSDGCTLLHIAASAGSWRAVELLIDAGVSPLPRDRRRKSAYDVSKDKDTRDSFRRGM
jgi:hypothetical protein